MHSGASAAAVAVAAARDGEAREGAPPRDDADNVVQAAMAEPVEAGATDDGAGEEDESDEQPAFAGGDQGPNGDRRPRRRGRRGGRRRRGGREDGREDGREEGLAGSISDELTPPPAYEAAVAVADFDGGSEPAPSLVQPSEPVAQSFRARDRRVALPQRQPLRPRRKKRAAEEKSARRRSTVREKVSFTSSPAPDTAPAMPAAAEHPAAAPAEAAPADDQPRKAGWWSRRFGGGE